MSHTLVSSSVTSFDAEVGTSATSDSKLITQNSRLIGGVGGIRTPVNPTMAFRKTRFPTELHGWELPPSPV